MVRIKREPRSGNNPHMTPSMGTPQRPITIDEGPVDFGAAPAMTGEPSMVLESLRERMARVERGQGLGGGKREAGTKVKSEDMETGPRPMTSGLFGKGAAKGYGKEVKHETDSMEVDNTVHDLGVPYPTGPLFYGTTAATAATEKAARRKAKIDQRKKTRDAKLRRWSDAERTREIIMSRLSDPERTVFDLALGETIQSLEAADQRGKKQRKKEMSRLYRALEIVRDLPLFREIWNTDVDRSLPKANKDLSRARRPAKKQALPRLGRLGSEAVERKPLDDDASSTLAEAASGLAIDNDDDDDDDMTPEMPVSSHPAPRTFGRMPSTESQVLVKNELSMDVAITTGNPKQFHQKHASIWEHHESAMRRHFQSKGFLQAVYSTKLAIQKKGFQVQAANEIQVEEARRITEKHLDGDTRTCITDFGGTAFDTEEFPTDRLWELSSTKLWHYYQDGDSWDQLGWIPGGYLRIRQLRAPRKKENTFQAEVVVEFGASTFTAPQVTMPLFTNSESLEFLAQHCDHYRKQEAVVRLRFFQGGHVQVVFPAAHLIKMDNGCDPRRAHGQLVEFAGVFMGKAD
ncbi:hypothetical protein HBI56_036950 [Parastagonospora nodorum]|uniref:Uncharacterized protein n=2 Tax=Phaeosphaeria nodorum (strain SN15 / ATCC MYA-4574 / FGSC 10173) TaxID=321614 RepID=A0A7U2EZ75_PHANO|nr:hypothetical protein SNOG_03820 [Parastagonospora nodorum SN15]KAH3916178.1 hypothetical protein HBH56_069850 [Parastagonospora nodorum]EAT89025.1 hypothetical protein SNOG_03820 [Parastagonospora nodorum SN15]KAH3932749.1 hypothetical protein HBH54_078270 [Parastagonospora nodorum]KAH3954562.1 hypothetical protein HBH53_016090 [Parastagonospora nodorum]KAH3986176.1 hypothetical protein HBH52_047250 [Parastagonospora nodorum]